MQQPKFEKRGPFTVVGLKIKSNMKAMQVENPFPKMWQDFMARMMEVKHIAKFPQYGTLALGLCWCDCQGECTCGEDSDFNAMASFVVDQAKDIPEGMEVIEIPEAEYAVFEHKGKLDALGQTYDYIFKTWVPDNEDKRTKGYELEWYDNRFKDDQDDSVLEILIPVLPQA